MELVRIAQITHILIGRLKITTPVLRIDARHFLNIWLKTELANIVLISLILMKIIESASKMIVTILGIFSTSMELVQLVLISLIRTQQIPAALLTDAMIPFRFFRQMVNVPIAQTTHTLIGTIELVLMTTAQLILK